MMENGVDPNFEKRQIKNYWSESQKSYIIRSEQDAEQDARLLGKEQVTYYVGFDSTSPSLHVGSLVPIMAMAHLQRTGHKPIAIIRGGTTMIGDPTDKTEMCPIV